MVRYLVRRLLLSVGTLVVSSFISFCVVAASGNPLAELRMRPGASQQQMDVLAHEFGLDDPVLVRYWNWLVGFMQGDWGRSVALIEARGDVFTAVIDAMSITVRLVVGAEILALLIGVVVGVLAAVKPYSIFDYIATGTAYVLFSMPVVCVAVVVKNFGVRFNDFLEVVGIDRWLSTAGAPSAGFTGSFGEVVFKYTGTFLLPTLSLALIGFAAYSRFQRSSMLEVMNDDHVRTARAKGLSQSRVIVRHVFRNSLIPVTTAFSLDFGTVLTGAFLVETVFGWPGMGSLLIKSIRQYDPHMLMGWLMVAGAVILLFNLMADVFYGVLDPRIRIS
ncbi:ABC transporter permease [Lentzea tibetensis]|uniref:ABC transporter permease n=1 Tax=Lentzea tibetensis TaxID=2591470 RepID=A0A563F2Z0_9PSEU|nr:ABC transporter permease [Lentzea tibetensis]TWP54336.1 ABC transporter permease [Lentzea tibetensis]